VAFSFEPAGAVVHLEHYVQGLLEVGETGRRANPVLITWPAVAAR